MAEESVEPFLAHAEQPCEGRRIEVRFKMRSFGLHLQFDERHELCVVLEVGVSLPLNISVENIHRHLRSSSQFDILLETFGEGEVTVHEAYDFVFEVLHLFFQRLILILQFFYVFFPGHGIRTFRCVLPKKAAII